ncbi:amidohydrolase family protein [Microbulbifer sp. EKSA008]|uniref:amidohydrolase family protein n=1 Tax=Microbulbifer sp. EKSA008 TaxID=3243367 RepID=UPI004041F68B
MKFSSYFVRSWKAAVAILVFISVAALGSWGCAWYIPPSSYGLAEQNARIVVTDITVIDTQHNTAASNQNLVIQGGRIAQVTSDVIPEVEGELRINGLGKYVMPGLIDMHSHVWGRSDLLAILAHGVTRTRVMAGNSPQRILKKWIDTGNIAGPHMVLSGAPVNQHSHYASGRHHKFIGSKEEARQLVRQQYQQGYQQVKVYDGLSREVFFAIADEAKKLGMPLAGHPPFGITLNEYLSVKPQSLEHVEMIFQAHLNYDYQQESFDEIVQQLLDSNVPVSPTLIVYDNVAQVAQHGPDYWHSIADNLELNHPAIKAMGEQKVNGIHSAKAQQDWQGKSNIFGDMTKQLNQAGVEILIASDGGTFYTPNGLGTIQEMQRLVEVGIPVQDVLRAATHHPAKALGISDKVGSVSTGFNAELLLLEDDPRENLNTLTRPLGVILDQSYFDRHSLSEMKELAKSTGSKSNFYFWWIVDNYIY